MLVAHFESIAEHLIANGREIDIDGETVRGVKKRLTYEESAEVRLRPGTEAFRLTVPKVSLAALSGGDGWTPVMGMRKKVDGYRYTVGHVYDLVDCIRFEITRHAK